MSQQTDVVVIGSGFGGSVAAANLTEAGFSVRLMERGPWWDTVPVRSMGIASRSKLPRGWRGLTRILRSLHSRSIPGGGLTANKHGLFEVFLNRGLNVVCSSGVGGGSHVYSGLNALPPDPNYWDDVGEGLSAETMALSYQRVMQRMGSRPVMADDHVPNLLADRFADYPEIDTDNVDYEIPVGFLFPEQPGESRSIETGDGVQRFELIPGEESNLGSENGGKTTMEIAFLARAMKQGLKVSELCEVRRIRRTLEESTPRYVVEFTNHNMGRSDALLADHVVLAAGTMNTLKLLMHSEADGLLASMPRLGFDFGGNGDFIGYWNLKDRERDLTVGMPTRGLLKLKDQNALGANRAWPMIAEGALPSQRFLPWLPWLTRKLQQGSYVVGMGVDAQNGNVTNSRGKLKIAYDPGSSELFSRINDAFRMISEITGRKIYHFKRPTTVHPTGGAIIGNSIADGVIDSNGEVFNNPGLYIADAAAFPKPIGGPPSMSIAAWSDHVTSKLVAAHRRPP